MIMRSTSTDIIILFAIDELQAIKPIFNTK